MEKRTKWTDGEKYAMINLENRVSQYYGKPSEITKKNLDNKDVRLNLIEACKRVIREMEDGGDF